MGRRLVRSGLGLLVIVVATTAPAAAIPSPELVVGTLSSMSQLFAVVSALVGGGAVAAGTRLAGRSSRGTLARRLGVSLLVVVAVGALAGNVHQHLTAASERAARLEATLLRPAARDADGRLLDEALREMSFSEQAGDPRGIGTEAASRMMDAAASGAGPNLIVLDIREAAEAEMGSLPGARHVRFPDLDAAGIDFRGRTALLFCHNGNRSGETCARLARQGIDCRFIVGGLEKWLAEGRLLGAGGVRSLADLRALPPFPNNRTLLETNDVRRLVAEAQAIFVDVRYPAEFASGHLKEAVNLPIRPLPTAELKRRLEALPRRPVIAPCYDRRSCFFAEILGLELTRMGRDFRGRYTAPWEYFDVPPRADHVEKLAALQSRGVWTRAVAAIAEILGGAAAILGLPLAIAMLALLSRLAVLPFSLKAERDQRVARQMADEVDGLKARLAHDPVRRGRALRELYRRHGLTPGRNLVALLFLPVMAISVEAASTVAVQMPQGVLWLDDLARQDPLFLLPVLFSLLAGGYMSANLAASRRQHLLIWLVAVPLLTAAVALLPAAGGLYVVASIALLVAQSWLAGGGPSRLRSVFATWRRRLARWRMGHAGIVALDDHEALSTCGNKALRLGQLRAAGLPVPRGLVLTEAFLSDFQKWDAPRRRQMLGRIWRVLGASRIAVRSSASGEDGAAQSFAGVFDSVLDVEMSGLEQAVLDVLGSFAAARAGTYGAAAGAANILIQPMVSARYAGVLFTEDPAATGAMLLEFVEGVGESLVAGRVAPSTCRFGRITGRRLDGASPPFDPAPLLALARQVEAKFGTPQDIEWALGAEGFVILQSRDITAISDAADEGGRTEWRKTMARAAGAGPDEPVLVQGQMTELLPRPSPLSLSLLESLWAPGGSVDLAARRLGLAYPASEHGRSLHATVFGRLYVDPRERTRRSLSIGTLAARRLRGEARGVERHFRSVVVPMIVARQSRMAATDLDRLSTRDLMDEFRSALHRFLTEVHVEVEVVNIAVQFLHDDARRLCKAYGIDADAIDLPVVATEEQQALRMALLLDGPDRLTALSMAIGHRSAFDYELAQPRYGEDPSSLEDVARRMISVPAPEDVSGSDDRQHSVVLDDLPRKVRTAVRIAHRFVALKEDAKHHVLRELSLLRGLLLAIDRRFGLGGLVFELDVGEVGGLNAKVAPALAVRARARRTDRRALESAPSLPPVLTPVIIEASAAGVAAAKRGGAEAARTAGTRVSGRGHAEGRAYVVSEASAEIGAPLDGFKDGDIIVSRMVPPAWLPYVLRSGGVITEVGGWLSHVAIVARERGIAMVVGCRGLDAVVPGTMLVVNPDGSVAPSDAAPGAAFANAPAG